MNPPAYPRIDSEEMRARSTDPATSHEAASKVDAKGQRGKIMQLMRRNAIVGVLRAFQDGWTADEIDNYIGWRVTTAGRRLSELKRRGLVEACGRRYTRSGRPATVYRACA